MDDDVREITKERGLDYGPFEGDMRRSSRVMACYLAHRFDSMGQPEVAAAIDEAMLAKKLDDIAPLFHTHAIKSMRKATGKYKRDHFVDGAAYDTQTETIQKQEANQ